MLNALLIKNTIVYIKKISPLQNSISIFKFMLISQTFTILIFYLKIFVANSILNLKKRQLFLMKLL